MKKQKRKKRKSNQKKRKNRQKRNAKNDQTIQEPANGIKKISNAGANNTQLQKHKHIVQKYQHQIGLAHGKRINAIAKKQRHLVTQYQHQLSHVNGKIINVNAKRTRTINSNKSTTAEPGTYTYFKPETDTKICRFIASSIPQQCAKMYNQSKCNHILGSIPSEKICDDKQDDKTSCEACLTSWNKQNSCHAEAKKWCAAQGN